MGTLGCIYFVESSCLTLNHEVDTAFKELVSIGVLFICINQATLSLIYIFGAHNCDRGETQLKRIFKVLSATTRIKINEELLKHVAHITY